eukprot:352186-Chlamydomonas_euryale.AAC.5
MRQLQDPLLDAPSHRTFFVVRIWSTDPLSDAYSQPGPFWACTVPASWYQHNSVPASRHQRHVTSIPASRCQRTSVPASRCQRTSVPASHALALLSARVGALDAHVDHHKYGDADSVPQDQQRRQQPVAVIDHRKGRHKHERRDLGEK